jgi:hypothetical protein
MPIEVLDSLRKAFQHRLNGVSGCCIEVTDWTTVLVRLIPKVPKPVDMTQWRPIALSSCVRKLYCAILISLLEELSGPLHREACGFRKGHQVAEITEALRVGLEKSKLYGQELTIIQADVLKAFDHMSHDEILRSLEYYGVPQRLQHSLLLELAGTVMLLVLEHVAAACPVLLFAAGKQGGTETLALWNRILDSRLAEAAKIRRDEGLGWKLIDEGYADEVITHLFWADDVYIVCSTLEGSKRMLEHFSSSIEQAGLRWKPESLKVLNNMNSEVFVESWNTCFGPLELHHVTSFIALGVAIDNFGSTDCAVNHRVGCFWVSWSALKAKFCSRRVPLAVRISRFYDTLVRSLLFNAGGWTPSERFLRRIGGIELRCLRAMGGRTKHRRKVTMTSLLALTA